MKRCGVCGEGYSPFHSKHWDCKGYDMSVKAEAKQATKIAAELKAEGKTNEEILRALNLEFEDGLYLERNGAIWRENVPDYLPAIRIL